MVLEQERLHAAQREAVRVQGIKDLKASLKLTFKSWRGAVRLLPPPSPGDPFHCRVIACLLAG